MLGDLLLLLLLLTSRHSLTVGAFAATIPQFANQILGGSSNVFRHYISGSRRVGRAAFSDIGQDFATGTLRLAAHSFGSAAQEWAEPTEETAEKIPIPCPRLNYSGAEWTGPITGVIRPRHALFR